MKYDLPTKKGYYGKFGGKFVPEILIPALDRLEKAYLEARQDGTFQSELHSLLKEYIGRPTPLTFADQLTKHYGRASIYLKREDLCHTGAHKINNAIGQVLLARFMNKKRIIAETGAGQHGVATATACAKFGIKCIVYMGAEDMGRQKLNVDRMHLLGAEVRKVESGTNTLKDATNEAIRDWVTNVDDTYYVIGSVVGPHPYPMMVRNFHRVIGRETREQINGAEGGNPDYLLACVGGGSNSIGFFYPFIDDKNIHMIGLEAAGCDIESDETAATLSRGRPGVLHGSISFLLQNEEGQVRPVHSISAGLDYPGVGPEHAHLLDTGRVEYHAVTDKEALEGVKLLSETEGIIPALETAHAVAWLDKLMPKTTPGEIVIVNCSGRGDKDMATISENL